MTTKEILIEAREKVDQGWCQASYQSGRSYCMAGAIKAVGFGRPWREIEAALDILSASIMDDSVIAWNDRIGRTKTEVLAAFGKAIENCA